ncbi:hypothetical protein ACJJIW_01500 [Microbulbifer sp. JMSA004]|uniref:hypothetical protein n=1 Tax=Microbulbifer sp. JMSA004 TaxID=3243370 RepID=UPI00403993BB
MNQILILLGFLLFSSKSFGESIFVVGEPYYRGATEYFEKEECPNNGECIEFEWFREYKIKNVKVLSGNIRSNKIAFVMATHTPRYTNGDGYQKWYLELVPITHPEVGYKAVDWYPVSEIVCTKSPLSNGARTLKSWYTSRNDEPCYDLVDLIESDKISNK